MMLRRLLVALQLFLSCSFVAMAAEFNVFVNNGNRNTVLIEPADKFTIAKKGEYVGVKTKLQVERSLPVRIELSEHDDRVFQRAHEFDVPFYWPIGIHDNEPDDGIVIGTAVVSSEFSERRRINFFRTTEEVPETDIERIVAQHQEARFLWHSIRKSIGNRERVFDEVDLAIAHRLVLRASRLQHDVRYQLSDIDNDAIDFLNYALNNQDLRRQLSNVAIIADVAQLLKTIAVQDQNDLLRLANATSFLLNSPNPTKYRLGCGQAEKISFELLDTSPQKLKKRDPKNKSAFVTMTNWLTCYTRDLKEIVKQEGYYSAAQQEQTTRLISFAIRVRSRGNARYEKYLKSAIATLQQDHLTFFETKRCEPRHILAKHTSYYSHYQVDTPGPNTSAGISAGGGGTTKYNKAYISVNSDCSMHINLSIGARAGNQRFPLDNGASQLSLSLFDMDNNVLVANMNTGIRLAIKNCGGSEILQRRLSSLSDVGVQRIFSFDVSLSKPTPQACN